METDDNWLWTNYTEIEDSLAKCNLCNKIYEVANGRLSKKAGLHLLKEHKIFNNDRAVLHNCWIYYKRLSGYRAICNACGKIYDTMDIKYTKKYSKKVHVSIILQQFWMRRYHTPSGQDANCNFCGACYNFTYSVKWVEKQLIELHSDTTAFP